MALSVRVSSLYMLECQAFVFFEPANLAAFALRVIAATNLFKSTLVNRDNCALLGLVHGEG